MRKFTTAIGVLLVITGSLYAYCSRSRSVTVSTVCAHPPRAAVQIVPQVQRAEVIPAPQALTVQPPPQTVTVQPPPQTVTVQPPPIQVQVQQPAVTVFQQPAKVLLQQEVVQVAPPPLVVGRPVFFPFLRAALAARFAVAAEFAVPVRPVLFAPFRSNHYYNGYRGW